MVTTQEATPVIPATIMEQIGGRAFYMLGAYNYGCSSTEPNYLSFRIKGSPKKVNYIKITLVNDLYNIEFGQVIKKGMDYKVIKTVEGIFVSQLKPIIEEETYLRTKI